MFEVYVTLILAILANAVLLIRWSYKKTRDAEIQRVFVHDMATNHLPHIYSALRQIASFHGIALEEPPPVQWIELNGVGGRRE